jgi:hypothetical protein
MSNDQSGVRRRIGRMMFVIAAVLIAAPLCLAAFQACENSRVTGEPMINIQVG